MNNCLIDDRRIKVLNYFSGFFILKYNNSFFIHLTPFFIHLFYTPSPALLMMLACYPVGTLRRSIAGQHALRGYSVHQGFGWQT
jgi:hypothetical protein